MIYYLQIQAPGRMLDEIVDDILSYLRGFSQTRGISICECTFCFPEPNRHCVQHQFCFESNSEDRLPEKMVIKAMVKQHLAEANGKARMRLLRKVEKWGEEEKK